MEFHYNLWGATIEQLLELCCKNIQALGSNLIRSCPCGMFPQSSSSAIYVPSKTRLETKQTTNSLHTNYKIFVFMCIYIYIYIYIYVCVCVLQLISIIRYYVYYLKYSGNMCIANWDIIQNA